MKPPCVALIGWQNSGKTTVMVRLVRALRARGLKVGTLKHAHHDFEMDRKAGGLTLQQISERLGHAIADDRLQSAIDWLQRKDVTKMGERI